MNANNTEYSQEDLNVALAITRVMTGEIEKDPKMRNMFKHSFDYRHPVFYKGIGKDLCGSWCNTNDPRAHCFVNNNLFYYFEFPCFSNNKDLPLTGKFLLLAKNVSFGSWYVCILNHKLVSTKYGVKEHSGIYCDGELSVNIDYNGDYCFTCLNGTGCCDKGLRYKVFDPDDVRKVRGYHMTRPEMSKKYLELNKR